MEYLNIAFEDVENIELVFTEPDSEGNVIGFGRLEDDRIIAVSVCPGGTGEVAIMTYEQAYSLHNALERFEVGVNEALHIAKDGLTTKEVEPTS